MKIEIQAIADDFERLRSHVRPEGNGAAGALAVSIEQAWNKVHADEAAAVAAESNVVDIADARPSSTEPA